MKAFEAKIEDVIGSKNYFIPAYQRPYKWDSEKAEQLVSDIDESFAANEKEYFIGSIICIKEDNKPLEVVDGQQRLITLTLILLQLAEKIEDTDAKLQLKKMVVKIDALAEHKTPKPCLKVREPENSFYLNHIIEGGPFPGRNLTANEQVFLNNRKKIGECFSVMDQDKLKKYAKYLLDCVFIAFVEVDDRASAFRLFNVLNDRGLPLSDADLLKSQLLSKAHDDYQCSKEVEKKWRDIENSVGEDKLNNFLSLHKISEKKDRNRVKKKNFEYYENRLKHVFDNNSEKMSGMLLYSAQHYEGILNGNMGAKQTTSFLEAQSKHEEWLPAFMAYFNKRHDQKKFPLFAELFEKVYMHGLLQGVPKGQREALCYYAVEAINDDQSFDEIMACVRNRADNTRFEEALDAKYFYDKSRPVIINLVKWVLFRVDEARHDDSASRKHPDWNKITVEHILPQNMMSGPYWRSKFNENEHDEWLHKLGNLTLIARGKNSAASNCGFDKKKKAYVRSNQKSPFEITKELCDLPEWDMCALQNRHERLKKEIKKLWWVE